ncbi:MAG TPA: type II and III secretion system protein family protein [Xanthobacteraceae bacterium]|nr:type II and III secretion system protein family protein [Xanthobacteraceae bacterium]
MTARIRAQAATPAKRPRISGSRKAGLGTLALAAAVAVAIAAPRALAGNAGYSGPPPQMVHVTASDVDSQPLALGVSKSIVIDLPRDIKDVLVADPKIANAVVRSPRRAYIIGSSMGQTNVYFFDAQGQQIAGFDIAVTRDLNGIRQAIREAIPDADITVDAAGPDGIILAGTASSQAEAQQAYDIAVHLVNAETQSTVALGSKVVNAIVVRGGDQVMLKVTVAEVERDLVKQLGINLSGTLGYGTAVLNFNNTNPFSASGQPLSTSAITGGFKNISATLAAMEQAGVIHTLAEPNMTAISGETATFLAGGEFPVLNGFSCSTATGGSSVSTCQPAIDFKKFGVSLNFTPVVLSEGRISLRVMTEVSQLSANNSLTINVPGTTQNATVPSIRTRRAETTVEIPSGGSLAMAGMIQNVTQQSINGLPGLTELPVLGALFKSRDYINQQTELMVIVTPYIVHAVARKDLSQPDDGFADSSDPAAVLLGRFNRIYGVGGMPEPPDTYRGKYGFILD